MGMMCNLGLLEGGKSEKMRIKQVGEKVKRTLDHWAGWGRLAGAAGLTGAEPGEQPL